MLDNCADWRSGYCRLLRQWVLILEQTLVLCYLACKLGTNRQPQDTKRLCHDYVYSLYTKPKSVSVAS